MSLRIAVHGASGRSGRHVLNVAAEGGCEVIAALVSPASSSLGASTGLKTGQADLKFSAEIAKGVAAADVVIDFSTPAAAMTLLRACVAHKKPAVIATTGFTEAQRQELVAAATTIPVVVAANTSLGVAALREIALQAQRILGNEYEIEITEAHHRFKKDAPSGTALSVAHSLADAAGKKIVTDRTSSGEPRAKDEIGIASIRAGDIVGEHTIFFCGPGERLEISHRVSDRAVFARGAIRLAQLLESREPAMYTVHDLLI